MESKHILDTYLEDTTDFCIQSYFYWIQNPIRIHLNAICTFIEICIVLLYS